MLVPVGVGALLLTYIAACAYTIIAASGVFPQTAFKGIIVGTLVGLVIAGVVNALALSSTKRIARARRREVVAGVVSTTALIGVATGLASLFLLPTLGRDPRRDFGAPDSTYRVESMDGRVEMRSGADLGSERWGFDAGLHCGVCYSIAGTAIATLGSALLALGGRGNAEDRPSDSSTSSCCDSSPG